VTVRLVLGLGFGDEGKGTIVDWLARQAPSPPLVVRWNGGPQAAHHVVTDDGRVHCFAQLGSASFVDGARTHLGPEMVVDLYALHVEADVFGRIGGGDVLARVTVDPRCVLVTPWHAILGRVREAMRGAGRHGSTGRGVGEAKLGSVQLRAGELGRGFDERLRQARDALLASARAVVAEGLPTSVATAVATAVEENAGRPDDATVEALIARGADRELFEAFADAASRPIALTGAPVLAEHVIFESAQGALLDRDHGFFPHVTPSRITRRAAEHAARELGLEGALEAWGVLRAYHTRHGEGPFPSEDAALAAQLPELHNRGDGPAGRFRVGWFDAVLARRALDFAGPIDRLAITNLDRIAAVRDPAVVTAWTGPLAANARPVLERVDAMAPAIERLLERRIDLPSWGPTAAAKRPSRATSDR
jgi:adenylosuccinate synthase